MQVGPFTPIIPFSKTNPLSNKVLSDHAEISVRVPGDQVVSAWNISNPEYHCYFQYGKNPPFFNSHLFVKEPFVNGELVQILKEKEEHQVETLATRLKSGAVSIQVIVEGYSEFYKKLAARLSDGFKIVFQEKEGNITGIVINTNSYTVTQESVATITYKQEDDDTKSSQLHIPYTRVKNNNLDHEMIVVGVHVDGCASQYPKKGLQALAAKVNEIWDNYQKTIDLIALGDFNTPTNTFRVSFNEIHPPPTLLFAPYTTHVNPNSHAAKYDHALLLRNEKNWSGFYQMKPLNTLTQSSQELVRAIETSIPGAPHQLPPTPEIEEKKTLAV